MIQSNLKDRRYFFVGIGGSGMLPLALYARARGGDVSGSDRDNDSGANPAKFEFLKHAGVTLFPEDGSGVDSPERTVVRSAAIEADKPDRVRARALGAPELSRAELLAQILNAEPTSIAIGGTSGKSTTTTMIGWILDCAGRDPSIINGAVMANYAPIENPYIAHRAGGSGLLVAEVDESDGSITGYRPSIGVITNITKDHLTMEQLRAAFAVFAEQSAALVLNADNPETFALAHTHAAKTKTFSLKERGGDFWASDVRPAPYGVTFRAHNATTSASVTLTTPGRHNVANALTAIATVDLLGITLEDAATALRTFKGVRRRLEIVGAANDVVIIDDFAHNPDKIAATLATLHESAGRLLLFWQPHGYGPLAKEFDGLAHAFATGMHLGDVLLLSLPVYKGGSTSVQRTHAELAAQVRAAGRNAEAIGESPRRGETHPPASPDVQNRAAAAERLLALAAPGDRIVIMGARDDTLTTFAQSLLQQLNS